MYLNRSVCRREKKSKNLGLQKMSRRVLARYLGGSVFRLSGDGFVGWGRVQGTEDLHPLDSGTIYMRQRDHAVAKHPMKE